MIGEAVLPAFVNKSGYDYIALLLGKLEHLAKIGVIFSYNVKVTL